jgi:16S rRNA (cytosine1402-N4)-methyltransferase
METPHTSVLMQEVLDSLVLVPSDVVVDATLGGAGHFKELSTRLGADGVIVGIDADPEAVERARAVTALDKRASRPTAYLICDNFRNLSRVLDRLGVEQFDKALFDLGWSGYQLAALRGFSFQNDEPLLMTYGEGSRTAAEIVNSASETELADIIYQYGEERYARRIAAAIVSTRKKARILTTGALVKAIEEGTPANYRNGKIHAATRTFQALRIAANDELGALHDGLAAALERVSKGGRIAIITFHSIEDRMVKQALRRAADGGLGEEITKKPLVPSSRELLANRRARSAKLRVFERAREAGTPQVRPAPIHTYA